jgi:hypothetical protein
MRIARNYCDLGSYKLLLWLSLTVVATLWKKLPFGGVEVVCAGR